MTHERSNGINLERIEVFLEPPDDMQCYSVYRRNAEDSWFIEDHRKEGCDCRNTVEAVVCPACHLCNHQMKCYCSVPNEYSCKHLHAINRFLKVQVNTDTDAMAYGDEIRKNTIDWSLLAARRKREIKRQKSRNPLLEIQNIDLTWKGGKKQCTGEDILQNESTSLEHVSKDKSKLEQHVSQDRAELECVSYDRSSLSKQVLQNEPSPLNKESQLEANETSIDLADSSKQVAENTEMQLAPVYVDKKAVQDDTSTLKTQCAPESAKNPVIRDGSLNSITEVASEKNVSRAKVAALLKEKIQPAFQITTESKYTSGRLSENDVKANGKIEFKGLVIAESVENSNGINTSPSISEKISEEIDTYEKTSVQNEVLEIRIPPVMEFSVEFDGDTLQHVFKENSAEYDNAELKIHSATECDEKLNGSNTSSLTSQDITLKSDLHKIFTDENNELGTKTPLVSQPADIYDPEFAAPSNRAFATNEEFVSPSASKSTGQPDNGATFEDGFKGVPAQYSESKSQASFKSSSESANDARTEEKLGIEEVTKKIDDLKLETRLDCKSESNVGKLELFQQDVSEDSPTVVTVEQKGMKTKSTKDIKPFARNTIEIDEPTVDPKTRAFSNLTHIPIPKTDTSTQTDLMDRLDVSTQTSELDFIYEINSNSSSVKRSKKKRKTKTQRKQLKQ